MRWKISGFHERLSVAAAPQEVVVGADPSRRLVNRSPRRVAHFDEVPHGHTTFAVSVRASPSSETYTTYLGCQSPRWWRCLGDPGGTRAGLGAAVEEGPLIPRWDVGRRDRLLAQNLVDEPSQERCDRVLVVQAVSADRLWPRGPLDVDPHGDGFQPQSVSVGPVGETDEGP